MKANEVENVLSLFDGMSCGQIALNRIGIKPKKYYASEIDKHAIKVTQANYPDTIQLGDVREVNPDELDKIDLVIGGSPCQGFSFAGKQLAFDDPRSALFFEFVRGLNRCKELNPDVKFLLENVRMKKEYMGVITNILGVEPICINSALVSAQNRARYYWTNIEGVEQPQDKGIQLKDILIDHANKCGAIRGRYLVNGKRAENSVESTAGMTKQLLEVREDHKSNCLTTVQKDNVIVRGKSKCVSCKGNFVVRATVQANAEHTYNGKVPTLTASMGMGGGNVPLYTDAETAEQHKGKYINTEERLSYRKLTPIECERLQTVPDNYTAHVSNTQRYKMLGNGWTVDVIAHIFKNLLR